MIKLQYTTFLWQNLCSTVVFVATLTGTAVLINCYPMWAYDPHIILKNTEFNITMFTTILLGLMSMIFSINPRWLSWTASCSKLISDLETIELDEVDCNLVGNTLSNKEQNQKAGSSTLSIGESINSEDDIYYSTENVQFANDSRDDIWLDSTKYRIWTKLARPILTGSVKHIVKDIDFGEIKTHCSTEEPVIERKIVFLNENSPRQFNLNDSDTFHHKVKRAFPTKLIFRILIGLGCFLFVLSPIIVASTFMDLSNNRTAYIYCVNQNETRIIQVRRMF